MLCVYLEPKIIPEFYCVCVFKRHHLLEMKEVKEQRIWTSSKNANKWAARVFHMVISHEQMRQLPEPVILTPDCTFYLSGELLKIPIPRHHPHRQNQQSQRWGPDFRAHLKLPSELNSQPNLGVLNLGLLSHQSTWPKYPVLGKFGIMAFQLCFVTSLGKQPLLRHPLLLLAWFTLSLFAGVCSGIYRDVTQRVKLNESLPFKLPWETHPSGNQKSTCKGTRSRVHKGQAVSQETFTNILKM